MSVEQQRALVLLLLPLVALGSWWSRGARPVWRWTAGLLLVALALYTVQLHLGWRQTNRAGLVGYDLYHYYLSGKYQAELEDEYLYVCSIVADREQRRPKFEKIASIRDLETYRTIPVARALERREECKNRFTPERWQEFREDLFYFQGIVPRGEWRTILIDRGANASPIWLLVGGSVASLVPVRWLPWATQLDTLFLAVALGFVFWAFGPSTALVALIFLLTCFSTRWPLIGGALFRYDWVAALIISVCLWHKQRPLASGAALAYATGMRLFPFLLFAGLGAQAIWSLLRGRTGTPGVDAAAGAGGSLRGWNIPGLRRLLPREQRFAVGFFLSLGLLVALASLDSGPRAFVSFFQKMRIHAASENISVMRVGLQIGAAYRGEGRAEVRASRSVLAAKHRIIEQQHQLILGVALLAALAVLLLARQRRIRDGELILLGVALVPLGLQISYYYYVFLIVPILLHADGLPHPYHVLGLLLLSWANALGLYLNSAGWPRYLILAPGSLVLSAYAVALLAAIGWAVYHRTDGSEPAPAPPPATRGPSA